MHELFLLLDHRSRLILSVLTLFFLSLESYYAVYRPLSIDEFNGAWSVAQLATGVPYVDYQPYKPVLGYSIQLALQRLAPDTWSGFLAVRLGMVYLTGGILFLGALWLRRVFRPGAVCLAYALMIVMTSLVEWAIEVRLDMLTALVGFVSLLLLLNRRIALAGAVAGLSFLISQKGTMYALAGGIALLVTLATQRDRRGMRDVLVYGVCVVLPIGLYVLYWSQIASFRSVCRPTFAQETQLHAITTSPYALHNIFELAWTETLKRNLFFYLCAFWAFCSLIALGRKRTRCENLLLFYGGTVVGVMLSLAQPWPYCFVLLVPTIFVLHVDLFDRVLERPWGLLSLGVFLCCYGLYGLLWPLSILPVVAQDDTGPQRQTIELTEALLEPEDRYFAGFNLLYRRDALARALSETDENGAHPTHEQTADQTAEILRRLQEEPIRLLIHNFKIDEEVPAPIRRHLYRTYAPLWSNVWIYAPQVRPPGLEVNLLFTDAYTLEMKGQHPVMIDGLTYAPGATVELLRGRHTVVTSADLRLKLRAARADHLLKPAYREPTLFFWPRKGVAPRRVSQGVWMHDGRLPG